MAMKEIDIREVKENLVHLLADEWALVTAGRGDALGTMTVSWGGIGELWGKDMATIYIRPQRYTKKFLDENNYFTLSFYPEQYKDALRLCGSKSGREINKVEATGLTPATTKKPLTLRRLSWCWCAARWRSARLSRPSSWTPALCRTMRKTIFTPFITVRSKRY